MSELDIQTISKLEITPRSVLVLNSHDGITPITQQALTMFRKKLAEYLGHPVFVIAGVDVTVVEPPKPNIPPS